MADDCLFCKIAAGDIPSDTVYEDDDFRVILDLSPAAKGHALIIPKKHYANVYEMDDEFAAKVLPLAKRIACAMKKALNCDGVNILQNNGEAAGQTVFHFHVHVIPRYNNDGVGITWKQLQSQPDEQKKLAAEIAAALK